MERFESDDKIDLGFCTIYRGEADCPVKRDYDCRVWMAEMYACRRRADLMREQREMPPEDFLGFVCGHLCTWDPYEGGKLCARYIAEFSYCGLNEKARAARTYCAGENLLLEKPRSPNTPRE